MKKTHYFSGITISIFIGLHLLNHTFSIFGADKHIEMMRILRLFYRNTFVESILLVAVFVQIVSGIRLFILKKKTAISGFDKLQIWSGAYLAAFFLIHLSAVFFGRLVLKLDTNFYFGVAGLNTFPLNLFFIPYYSLAIIAIFGHFGAIHSSKMKKNLFGTSPNEQAKIIVATGIILTVIIFYGLTNHFNGVQIPKEYDVLIGK